jgi:hypothetical protein
MKRVTLKYTYDRQQGGSSSDSAFTAAHLFFVAGQIGVDHDELAVAVSLHAVWKQAFVVQDEVEVAAQTLQLEQK